MRCYTSNPAYQLTDAQLCTESGYAIATGNSERLAEVAQEGQSRVNAGRMTISQDMCAILAQTGNNRVQKEMIEDAQRQQASQAMMQQGLAIMQQDQQNMQSMQQTQALNNIANSISGY
ncbi:hypothetical protein CIAM_45020 (plasmid) [Citrobacter amalonaticus]|nr:hypothetical protein CIAM_45020 [Citrobacter amalonaticus]